MEAMFKSSYYSVLRFRTFYNFKLFLLIVSIIVTILIISMRCNDNTSGTAEENHIQALQQLNFEQMTSEQLAQVDQSNIHYIQYIRESGSIKSPSTELYNLAYPSIDPSMGQSDVVLKVLKNMTNGFFVECGAFDGEWSSNTLDLEKQFGWTGLLIEADPSNYKLLQQKHRKAHSVNVCLAIQNHPHQVMFASQKNIGKISTDGDGAGEGNDKLISILCIPFYSLIASMGLITIDYFSLDVEVNEYDILKTIPFDKMFIKVLSVEYIHNNVSSQDLIDFMKDKGYKVETKLTDAANNVNDFIFVHESVK